MIFPKKDYLTFNLDKNKPVEFSFPTKKPKKIWFNSGSSNASFRLVINEDDNGMLVTMTREFSKEITIPSTVNSIKLVTSVETTFLLTILVEEWGN